MNVDDALALADWLVSTRDDGPGLDAVRPDTGSLVSAVLELAAWVREHRPQMPRAQRGRSVDHAVRPATSGEQHGLVSLCGGLAPEWQHDPIDVSPLDQFDPTSEHACRSCVRHLPVELRPPVPVEARRRRQRDSLAGVEVNATVRDGEYHVEVTDAAGEQLVEPYMLGVELPELLRDVRAALRHRASVPQSDP